MNILTAITTALVAGVGAAFQGGVIPGKYAGFVLIGSTILQAFQGSIHKTPSSVLAPPVKKNVEIIVNDGE